MIGSTVGLAAAANYPAPFISGGNADVAVVYGSTAATTDLVAVTDVTANLQAALAAQTATTGTTGGGSVSGEAAPLFTSGTKLYINDSLNAVKSILTETELPTLLADGTFSGNVDATYTQSLILGTNPSVTFAKQPTSSDDPEFGLTMSTTQANYIYNATVTFNKVVNFTHGDSKGEDITLFGQRFTIASATDNTNLVLLKTAEKLSLTSNDPTAEVTLEGATYTVELVSASDTSATVKITDSNGNSETKEINENASKTINGITVAITNADETNLKLSASVIAGAEKVTLTDGSSVTIGEDADVIDGTLATFSNASIASGTTKLTLSVVAPNSDEDAILPGKTFMDPVFGSFKIDFAGLNIPQDNDARETFSFNPSGDDKMELTFTDYRGSEKNVQYARNVSGFNVLQVDSDGRNMSVFEAARTYRNEYIVVGNEDEGYLLRVSQITNQTTGFTDDKIRFVDVMSGGTYDATTPSAEGTTTVTVGGKVYSLTYLGASTASEDTRSIRLNYPDSTGTGAAVVYPTIQTSKGSKLAFYKPINITLANWDGATNNLTSLRFPDGDGYTDVAIVDGAAGGNFSFGGSEVNFTSTRSADAAVGKLRYNATSTQINQLYLRLENPTTGVVLDVPSVIIFEEKDDNSEHQAIVIPMATDSTSSKVGVSAVVRTWGEGDYPAVTLASDSDITEEADLWGIIATIDSNDADQKKATVTYPDEQIYAQLYVGEESSAITAGTTSSGTVKELGSVSVADSEVSSVSGKNLIVIGGSCVNTEAASLLGGSSAICGADWETKTGVGSGSFLIESFSRSGGKVATLVAGYNAGDTSKAAKYLTTQKPATDAGKKYVGSVATSATLVETPSA